MYKNHIQILTTLLVAIYQSHWTTTLILDQSGQCEIRSHMISQLSTHMTHRRGLDLSRQKSPRAIKDTQRIISPDMTSKPAAMPV